MLLWSWCPYSDHDGTGVVVLRPSHGRVRHGHTSRSFADPYGPSISARFGDQSLASEHVNRRRGGVGEALSVLQFSHGQQHGSELFGYRCMVFRSHCRKHKKLLLWCETCTPIKFRIMRKSKSISQKCKSFLFPQL